VFKKREQAAGRLTVPLPASGIFVISALAFVGMTRRT